VIAADWAEGFYDGINLRSKAWDDLFEDQTGLKLMEPIIILCGKQEGASDLSPSAEAELMREATDHLESSVVAIHQFWQGRRGRR
jgi:yecA family protein